MTQFEKFQEVLREMGLSFKLTDDSEEYTIEEVMNDKDGKTDTAVVINHTDVLNEPPIIFLFRKDGSFKEVVVF